MSLTATTTEVSRDVALDLYTRIRREFSAEERLRNGIATGEFFVVIWPSRGQEAIPAGIGAALRPDDRLVTNYRGLHDHIGKGVPLSEVLGEVLGSRAGASGGKGGTMHIAAPDQGVFLTTGIVGAGVPIGVGQALAARQEGSDRVVVVTFGDGATNTGSFHEGVNLAAVWKLPVIFVCQNNGWAEMTPIEHTMNIDEVRKRALAYDIPGIRVDGNDPEAVYAAVGEAAERGRRGEGPTLIEAVTFRFKGHYFGDQMKYFPADELAKHEAADPLITYRRRLLERGDITADELDAIEAKAVADVAEALDFVHAAGKPDDTDLATDLYAEMDGIPA